MEQRSSFDNLVLSLGRDERSELLHKLESYFSQEGREPEVINTEIKNTDLNEIETDLSVKYRAESFLVKIIIIIKALFTGMSQELLYNDLVLNRKRRDIGRQFPELFNAHDSTLLNGFFEFIHQLKLAADFFRPAVAAYEEDPGECYVLLSSLILPELSEEIEQEASPYNIPFDRSVTSELRLSLIRKMEECLQDIPADRRAELYSAVCSLSWLRQFVNLPFDKFMSRFGQRSDGFYCEVEAVSNELAAFSKVFSAYRPVPVELICALFLISEKAEFGYSEVSNYDLSNQRVADYEKSSKSHIDVIKSFRASVPLKSFSMLSFGSASWQPDNPEGAEDWFIKYKNHWRKLFDRKWEAWLLDRKKEQLKGMFLGVFGINELPLFPYRPWASVWGGVPFGREYTLGFINSFFGILYPKMEPVFKKIMIEGDFIQKENCVEFTDAFNGFGMLRQGLEGIVYKLTGKGPWLTTIKDISKEKVRTLQTRSRMSAIMLSIETEVELLFSKFKNVAGNMLLILEGILKIRTGVENHYASISNLSLIGGHENAKFIASLTLAKNKLESSISLLDRISDIDSSGATLKTAVEDDDDNDENALEPPEKAL